MLFSIIYSIQYKKLDSVGYDCHFSLKIIVMECLEKLRDFIEKILNAWNEAGCLPDEEEV